MGPIFFNDNLILSADTITEPTTKTNTTDLMDYVKDGRSETYITLTDTADHIFEYIFLTAQPLNFFQLKGCTAHDYLVQVDEGAGYVTLITGAFTAVLDKITWYSATTKNIVGLKITLSHEDFNSVDSVLLAEIIACGTLYTLAMDAKYYPRLKIDFTENQNWLGAKRINKTRSWFECDIKFDGFASEAQADLVFIRTLQNRNTPFYLWLNGNRPEVDFESLGEPWALDNIYRVYDSSKLLDFSHSNGQNDTGNITVANTLSLVEASFVEET